MDIKGVGPEVETVTNEQGGRQSVSPFAFHLTDPLVEFELAKLLAEGSKKYERDNWRKLPIEDHLNHTLQHIHAYRAEDEQEDNHLVHALARLHFACALDLVIEAPLRYKDLKPGQKFNFVKRSLILNDAKITGYGFDYGGDLWVPQDSPRYPAGYEIAKERSINDEVFLVKE